MTLHASLNCPVFRLDLLGRSRKPQLSVYQADGRLQSPSLPNPFDEKPIECKIELKIDSPKLGDLPEETPEVTEITITLNIPF